MDQELLQFLDERFHGLVNGLDQRFERIDQRFEAVDRRFDQMDDRIEEAKRHNGILIEGVRHEIHLLAEGLATHIEAENVRHQAIQEQFRETRALIHLSYEQLHQRIENLERNRQN